MNTEVCIVVNAVVVEGSSPVLGRYNKGMVDGTVVGAHQHQAVGRDGTRRHELSRCRNVVHEGRGHVMRVQHVRLVVAPEPQHPFDRVESRGPRDGGRRSRGHRRLVIMVREVRHDGTLMSIAIDVI